MNDGDLIRAVQAGDRASFTILYQRYVKGVWRYMHLHLSRDHQAAEDVVSETFLAAIRTIGTFDPRYGTVYGWLLGIARNKLRDHLRRQGCRRTLGDELSTQQCANSCVSGANSVAPDGRLIAAETRDAVVRVLTALDDEQRLVLEWKYVDMLAVREIAERLGRTEKAVDAILYRARRSFRAIYAPASSRKPGRAWR
jgi:RNA polymerase sigma-70 factor, ECF subfamily